MRICLNMIVKNESANLPRLFKSLENVVDYYVICDTGSSDDTIEKIKELGNQYNMKGIVFSEPWVDFAHNRNVVLKKAFDLYNSGSHQCNWLLIIDADEALNTLPPNLIQQLDKNLSYQGYQLCNGILAKQILLLNIQQQKWFWKGTIHNYLVNAELYPLAFNSHLVRNALYFKGAKSHEFKNPQEKSKRDANVLSNELQNVELSSNNIHRFFELGNEFFESGALNESLEAYSKIVDSDHEFHEFKYLALLQIANIHSEFLSDSNKAEQLYTEALKRMPDRKEAYYYLAKLYQKEQLIDKVLSLLLKAHSIPKSNLSQGYYIADYDIYSWKIELELAVNYFKRKSKKEFNEIYEEIILEKKIPKDKMGIIDSMKNMLNAMP